MGIKERQELPRRLEGIQRRIERWRQTCEVRSRIPDSLWAAAVRMARAYGVNRTARALRLDYYGLKKRVEQQAVVAVNVREAKGSARFVELAPFSSAAPANVSWNWRTSAEQRCESNCQRAVKSSQVGRMKSSHFEHGEIA